LKRLIVLAAFMSSPAFAYRQYLTQFGGYYSSNGVVVDDLVAKDSCGLCHNRAGGGGARNPYGEDFKRIVLGNGESFGGLEFLDSDGDGFINLEEIYLQSSPGKSSDAPNSRIEVSFDKAAGTATVKAASSCAKLEVRGFGFTFSGNTEVSFAGSAQQTIPAVGTAGVIIAKCAAEEFVGSVTVN
jgi:hypothetical protein